MTTALTELTLINALRSRSSVGAVLLYDTYAANLYRIILGTVKNHEQADLLLEQTLLTIWNNFDKFDRQEGRLSLWIMGQARQIAKKAIAEQKVNIEVFPDESKFGDDCAPLVVALA
jgi:DNA-directed RNA polymerase specialized sigma24 family protein